jgi:tRNA (guanine-N7-)-methyltransferase
MRLRHKPWADKEFAENPLFVQNSLEHKGKWQALFAAEQPIHLEIGCGKGRFTVENALANPNVNFLAMEKQERILCMALRQGRDAGLPPNLRFFCDDAEYLPEMFAPGELSRIYINFCDPWRARGKWRKRRLTHRNFLATYENLMGSGQIHFKTDDKVLFNFSLEEFRDCGWHLENVTYDLHDSGWQGNIMTEYEEKFAGEGMKICRLEAYKT